MAQAKKGDNVKINFTGKLEDGTVFASTSDTEALEFQLGEGKILPGIEKAVEGMAVGQSKSVKLPSDEAYGQKRDDLVAEVARDQFPDDLELEVGQRLQVPQQQGQPEVVTVVGLTDEMVTLDANHPLAGRDLDFDLELVEITSAAT